MEKEELKKRVEETVAQRGRIYLDLGLDIYTHPETGYKEERTTRILADALEELGLKTERGIAVTGCRAFANQDKKGPKAVVMGELDALLCPGHKDSSRETGAMHHQIITKGGDAVNSVPANAMLETTIRACNMKALMDANRKVNRSIRGAAVALGGKAEVMDSPGQLPQIWEKYHP